VLLTDPLPFAQFSRLLARSHLVITDSGGIQEEAPSLDKPVLVTRETTERLEGVAAGTLQLVGADAGRIAAAGDRLLSDPEAYKAMAEAHNPYGDGRASERIIAVLEHLVRGGEPPHPFGAGYDRWAVVAATGFELPADPLGIGSGRVVPSESAARLEV
jgi:UDP-N-acetylglucosamine 2-epimerase (non-hydrolysing)